MRIVLLFCLIIFTITLVGCTRTEPSLQSVKFYGGPHKSTIKITKDEKAGDFNLRGSFAVNRDSKAATLIDEHSLVNDAGIYEVQPVEDEIYFIEQAGVNIYEFEGDNMQWELPEVQTMFEIEYNLSSSMSIYGGGSYSKSGKNDLYGYNFGLGFFKEGENWALRFDTGIKQSETIAEVEYIRAEDVILTGNNSRKVYFFEDREKEKFFNLIFGLTANTRRDDWVLNGFLNYTLGWQNFYSIEPKPVYPADMVNRESDVMEYNQNYHSFAVGLYKDLDELGKLIGGIRFTKYTDERGRLFIPDYFLQFDLDVF